MTKTCFSNKSDQHPIFYICLSTRRLYKTMQYANDNRPNYVVKFGNARKFNESCNGSLIAKGVQEHGMNIIFPLQNTVFYFLQEDEKKEAERPGE